MSIWSVWTVMWYFKMRVNPRVVYSLSHTMKGWQLAAALCSQKIFCKNKNLFASKVQIKIVQVTKEVLDKSAALMFAVIYQPQANLTIMKAPPPPPTPPSTEINCNKLKGRKMSVYILYDKSCNSSERLLDYVLTLKLDYIVSFFIIWHFERVNKPILFL